MALQLRRRFLLLPRCYSRRVTTTPLPPPPPTSTPMLHFGSQGYLRNFMPYSPLGPSQMRGVAARNDSARQMSSGISSHLAPQLKSSAFFNTGLSGNYSFLGLRAADTCGIALESNSIGSARSFSTTCGKQVRFLIANKSSVGNPNLKMEQESAAHSLFHRSERRQSTSAASGAITDEASTSTSKSCTDTKKDSGRRNSGADDKLQVSADATEKKASTKKKRRFFKTNKAPSKSADGRIKSETGSKKEVIADTEENKLLRDTNGRFGKTSKAASKSGEKSSVNQQENKADTSKSKQDAETPKLKKTMNRSRRSSKAKKSGSATAPAEKPSVNQQENNADTSKSQKGSDTSKVKKTVNRSRRSSEAKKTAGATAPAEKRSVNQQENNAAISKSQKGADTSEVKKTVNKPNISVKAKKSAAAAATAPAVDGSGSETKPLMPLYPPTSKSVVVVESATKANVIQKYLGGMYEVIPSHGHVRDLAARSRSVRPEDDFSMVWEVPPAAWTHLKRIRVALRGAENLILASDPDREGEAIAWHLKEMLEQQGAIKKDCHVTVARVVFHEITEDAIKKALMSPRYIDMDLVNAYLARRSLDYLIGFGISPLIWKKLPGCQSAGRVQSAALALVCDQEAEIEQFIAQEYWTIDTEFKTQCPDSSNGLCLTSRIKHLKSNKLDQLSISSHEDARAVENMIYTSPFEVVEIKRSKVHKNPPMPFITSSLQQDAANKLHFTAGHTMKVAQKLYEGITLSSKEATGLITYMRTDGFHISDGAAEDIRSLVKERYGLEYASEDVRKYSKKVINAQEAHEAIRPTSIRRLPSSLVGILDEDSLKLYTLIWKRTMACQMEDSRTELVQVDIGNPERDITFHSAASRFDFKGYEAVYEDTEACLSNENSEGEAVHNANFEALSKLEVKDLVSPVNVHLAQHFTKPPSRYSEGALIKKLEELGIGRPSTYAFVMRVLQDRKYVMIKNRFLHPEFRGRMVSAFLSQHFSEIANYSFTANMETELDNVSAGSTEWKGLLKGFWERFDKYCRNATRLDVKKVERMLEEKFRSFLFPDLDRDSVCPSCSQGTLRFRVSKFGEGYFVACDKHPKCKYVARTFSDEDEDDDTETSDKILTSFHPRLLGAMPDSDENVFLKQGPYGYYVQIGDDRKGMVQKRAPLSGVKDIDSVTIEDAIELLQYPKLLGKHPDDDIPVVLAHSKAGFTIRHRRTVAPLPRSADLKKITLERAVKLLTGKNVKIFGRPKGKVDKDAEPFEWH